MVQTSYPFAAAPGNIMTEDYWTRMMRYFQGTGVIGLNLDSYNELAVTADNATRVVTVDSGSALIKGHFYDNSEPIILPIAGNATDYTRIDTIVLECKWGLDAGITAIVVKGTPDPDPYPPSLTTTYGTRWQFPLCDVVVVKSEWRIAPADLTDRRVFTGLNASQSVAITVSMPGASAKMKSNSDFVIGVGAHVDASIKIQEALDYVEDNYTYGGTVMLSEGQCYIQNQILIPTKVTLAGCGVQTEIIQSSNPLMENPTFVIPYKDSTVRDMTLTGNATPFAAATPPAIDGVCNGVLVYGDDCVVKNMTITLMRGNGVFVDQSATGGTYMMHADIRDCYISYCYGAGVRYDCNNGWVVDNTILACGDYGIYVYAAPACVAEENIIQGNYIRETGLPGINVYANATGYLRNNAIMNNKVSSAGREVASAGIFLDSGAAGHTAYTSVVGNICWKGTGTAPHFGIQIGSNAYHTRVIGNNVYDSNGDGDAAHDIADSGDSTIGATISYNLMH